jgi:hypothetical protein
MTGVGGRPAAGRFGCAGGWELRNFVAGGATGGGGGASRFGCTAGTTAPYRVGGGAACCLGCRTGGVAVLPNLVGGGAGRPRGPELILLFPVSRPVDRNPRSIYSGVQVDVSWCTPTYRYTPLDPPSSVLLH